MIRKTGFFQINYKKTFIFFFLLYNNIMIIFKENKQLYYSNIDMKSFIKNDNLIFSLSKIEKTKINDEEKLNFIKVLLKKNTEIIFIDNDDEKIISNFHISKDKFIIENKELKKINKEDLFLYKNFMAKKFFKINNKEFYFKKIDNIIHNKSNLLSIINIFKTNKIEKNNFFYEKFEIFYNNLLSYFFTKDNKFSQIINESPKNIKDNINKFNDIDSKKISTYKELEHEKFYYSDLGFHLTELGFHLKLLRLTEKENNFEQIKKDTLNYISKQIKKEDLEILNINKYNDNNLSLLEKINVLMSDIYHSQKFIKEYEELKYLKNSYEEIIKLYDSKQLDKNIEKETIEENISNAYLLIKEKIQLSFDNKIEEQLLKIKVLQKSIK